MIASWLVSCSIPNKPDDSFVKVSGLHFSIGGKPYYFVGTNMWYGANLGSPAKGGDRQRLIRELDLLQSLGINNLRVMGASEGDSFRITVNPAFQSHPGTYNEQLLTGLDFLLDEMSRRGMYAVIYVNNYWEWSGGMAQYVAWDKHTTVPNPNFEPYDWAGFMNFSAGFYGNENANRTFHEYLRKLLNRRNTVNHKLYKNDPAIMSWQLANEPRPGHGEEGERNFKEIHQYPSVDYMTYHLWLLNWGWYDPLKAEETYASGVEKALDYIRQHIAFAAETGKPAVLEEFGIPRDGHAYSPEATTAWRDKYFSTVLQYIHDDAASGGPMAGSNFWAWGGFGKAREPQSAKWQPGDDIICRI